MDTTGQTVNLLKVDGKIQKELWKLIEIKEVKGKYKISNYGRVKSLARFDTRGRFRQEKLLRWRKNGGRGKQTPYYHVCLCNGSWQKNFKIHVLVAKAFVKGYKEGYEVNHEDGVKSNNFQGNLSWMSHKDNCQHAHDNGLTAKVRGHQHGRQKLTEEQVEELYITHLQGVNREDFNANELGRHYGVNSRAILSVYRKEAWKWLTDKIDKEFLET